MTATAAIILADNNRKNQTVAQQVIKLSAENLN